MTQVYNIDVCPLCREGLVGFYCDAAGHFYLACDDCDTCWKSPEAVNANTPGADELLSASPATFSELELMGWARYVKNPPSVHFPDGA